MWSSSQKNPRHARGGRILPLHHSNQVHRLPALGAQLQCGIRAAARSLPSNPTPRAPEAPEALLPSDGTAAAASEAEPPVPAVASAAASKAIKSPRKGRSKDKAGDSGVSSSGGGSRSANSSSGPTKRSKRVSSPVHSVSTPKVHNDSGRSSSSSSSSGGGGSSADVEDSTGGKCQALTLKGTRCRNPASHGSKHCKLHNKQLIQADPTPGSDGTGAGATGTSASNAKGSGPSRSGGSAAGGKSDGGVAGGSIGVAGVKASPSQKRKAAAGVKSSGGGGSGESSAASVSANGGVGNGGSSSGSGSGSSTGSSKTSSTARRQCRGLSASGKQCSRLAKPGSAFCHQHGPRDGGAEATCIADTGDGTVCANPALPGTSHCAVHAPAGTGAAPGGQQAAAAAAPAAAAGSKPPPPPPAPLPAKGGKAGGGAARRRTAPKAAAPAPAAKTAASAAEAAAAGGKEAASSGKPARKRVTSPSRRKVEAGAAGAAAGGGSLTTAGAAGGTGGVGGAVTAADAAAPPELHPAEAQVPELKGSVARVADLIGMDKREFHALPAEEKALLASLSPDTAANTLATLRALYGALPADPFSQLLRRRPGSWLAADPGVTCARLMARAREIGASINDFVQAASINPDMLDGVLEVPPPPPPPTLHTDGDEAPVEGPVSYGDRADAGAGAGTEAGAATSVNAAQERTGEDARQANAAQASPPEAPAAAAAAEAASPSSSGGGTGAADAAGVGAGAAAGRVNAAQLKATLDRLSKETGIGQSRWKQLPAEELAPLAALTPELAALRVATWRALLSSLPGDPAVKLLRQRPGWLLSADPWVILDTQLRELAHVAGVSVGPFLEMAIEEPALLHETPETLRAGVAGLAEMLEAELGAAVAEPMKLAQEVLQQHPRLLPLLQNERAELVEKLRLLGAYGATSASVRLLQARGFEPELSASALGGWLCGDVEYLLRLKFKAEKVDTLWTFKIRPGETPEQWVPRRVRELSRDEMKLDDRNRLLKVHDPLDPRVDRRKADREWEGVVKDAGGQYDKWLELQGARGG